MRTKVVRLGETARTYQQFIKRLKALGCVFCPECYAYAWPDHKHAGAVKLNKAA